VKRKRAGINWAEVRRRLDESGRALERALTPEPERLAAIYRQRAEQLARRRDAADSPAGSFAVLVFALRNEVYALPLADLAGLFPLRAATPVPGGPPELVGIVNVRGALRSVVDLGRLLGLPAETAGTGYVLLVHRTRREIALRVDQVERLAFVSPVELTAPPAKEAPAATGLVRGLTPDRLRLLDTEALLAHPIWATE
jgi:purine-binding chemotaxis protein CheW